MQFLIERVFMLILLYQFCVYFLDIGEFYFRKKCINGFIIIYDAYYIVIKVYSRRLMHLQKKSLISTSNKFI